MPLTVTGPTVNRFFSSMVENHGHAIALHDMFYNFVRIHKTPRCTPATAAGVTKRLWGISDIVALLDMDFEKSVNSN
jgi:hypothetical protein